MRKTFAPLDDVLIERLFQPASDFIAGRMGVGCGSAACFCIDIASISWIVSRVGAMSNAVAIGDAGTAVLDIALLLLGIVALVSVRTVVRQAGAGQANPLRLAMQPHRVVVLVMMIARILQCDLANLGDAADLAMLLFAASALYLAACGRHPPVRRVATALAAAPAK